jgi:bifunctional DNase/RNase
MAVVFPIEQTGESARLTLKEKNGARRIAMSVGLNEAFAIAQKQQQAPAPGLSQGYQLTQTLLQQLGGRVERVTVYDATGSEYFAHLVLAAPSGQQVVAFRPAEAVTLAITAGAPIFVEDKVLTQYGQR